MDLPISVATQSCKLPSLHLEHINKAKIIQNSIKQKVIPQSDIIFFTLIKGSLRGGPIGSLPPSDDF